MIMQWEVADQKGRHCTFGSWGPLVTSASAISTCPFSKAMVSAFSVSPRLCGSAPAASSFKTTSRKPCSAPAINLRQQEPTVRHTHACTGGRVGRGCRERRGQAGWAGREGSGGLTVCARRHRCLSPRCLRPHQSAGWPHRHGQARPLRSAASRRPAIRRSQPSGSGRPPLR